MHLHDENKYFDFIYIDGAHDSQNVIQDAILAWSLLSQNGIIIFDDYDMPTVKTAVDSFINCFKKEIKVLNHNNQMAIKRVKGGINDHNVYAVVSQFPVDSTSLDLSNNKVGNEGVKHIVKYFKNLKHLNLSNNKISNEGFKEIAMHCNALESLNLSVNQIDAQGVSEAVPYLYNLKILFLGSNKIGDLGATEIAKNLLNLEELYLGANQLGDKGTIEIAKHLTNLTSLDLSWNEIDNAGAIEIAQNLTKLKFLGLSGNLIQTLGAKQIVKKLVNLASLDLSWNKISLINENYVKNRLNHLKHLNLEGNNLEYALMDFNHVSNLQKNYNFPIKNNTTFDSKKRSYIFFGFPVYGHTAPTIGLVKELVKQGNKVTYINNENFRTLIESSGAIFVNYNTGTLDEKTNKKFSNVELRERHLQAALEIEPWILKNFSPQDYDVVIYDQLAIWGKFFAKKNNLPSFCSSSMLLIDFDEYVHTWPEVNLLNTNKLIIERIDKLNEYGNCIKSYKDIINTCTCEDADQSIVYFNKFLQPKFNSSRDNKILFLDNRFLENYKLKALSLQNKYNIFISFGTLYNDKYNVIKLLIKALNAIGNYNIIISAGNNDKNYNELKNSNIDANVQVYKFVDQLTQLANSSIFITHGGMNSVYEALYFSVPMLVIPQTNEQIKNAKIVKKLGMGLLLEEAQVNEHDLKQVLITIKKDWNIYKDNIFKIKCLFSKESYTAEQIIIKMNDIIEKY